MRTMSMLLAMALWPVAAEAGPCDRWLRAISSAEGTKLVQAYDRLTSCDADLARTELWNTMKQAKELGTLIDLSVAGIRNDAFNDLWKAMDKLAYDQRAPVAEAVGAVCKEEPKVLVMLQGAYIALKGSDFASWGPAMVACGSDDMVAWMEEVVKAPPKSEYNAKYNAMLTSYVDVRGPDALPVLEEAARAAASGGPVNNLLDMMQRSIQPKSMRDEPDAAHQDALAEALVRVAEEMKPEQARLVAARLYTAGREAQAASLLPRVYPDAVGSDGAVSWGVAAIERCDGRAFVHYATYTESPPTRWAVQPVVEGPLRAVKPKLKCDAGEWPVRVSDAPMADGRAVKAWADEIAQSINDQGDKTKVVSAKVDW